MPTLVYVCSEYSNLIIMALKYKQIAYVSFDARCVHQGLDRYSEVWVTGEPFIKNILKKGNKVSMGEV